MKTMATMRMAVIGMLVLAPLASCQAEAQGVPQQQGTTQSAVEQRIQSLKTQLGIMPQQEPAWDAFAQKMRDNANATDRLAQQRSNALQSLNAVDNMRSYARIAHEYAANADRLTAAFEGLYAGLSPAQRQTADTLLRQQAAASQTQ